MDKIKGIQELLKPTQALDVASDDSLVVLDGGKTIVREKIDEYNRQRDIKGYIQKEVPKNGKSYWYWYQLVSEEENNEKKQKHKYIGKNPPEDLGKDDFTFYVEQGLIKFFGNNAIMRFDFYIELVKRYAEFQNCEKIFLYGSDVK